MIELTAAMRRILREWSTTAWIVGSLVASTIAVITTAVFYLAMGSPVPGLPAAKRTGLLEIAAPNGLGTRVFAYREVLDWRDAVRDRARIAAFRDYEEVLSVGGDHRWEKGCMLDEVAFGLFQLAPVHGRLLHPDDFHDGARSILISERLWHRRFGGDPQCIGREIRLNGNAWTIVGILPAAFQFPVGCDFWMPIHGAGDWRQSPTARWHKALVQWNSPEPDRRVPELISAAASTDNNPLVAVLHPISAELGRSHYLLIRQLLAVGALLALAAVANIGGIVAGRITRGGPERAVRQCLGATRWQSLQPQVCEGVILGCFAGAISLPMALATIKLMQQTVLVGDTIPSWWSIDFFPEPAIVTLALPLFLCGCAYGVALVQIMIRPTTGDLAREASVHLVTKRVSIAGSLSIAAQYAALTLLLVACLGLAGQVSRIARTDLGIDATNVAQLAVTLLPSAEQPLDQRWKALLRELSDSPFVESLGAGNPIPGQSNPPLHRAFIANGANSGVTPVIVRYVSPGFFRTLRIKTTGRDFSDADSGSVALVDANCAKLIGDDAIGATLRVSPFDREIWRAYTIVGIASPVLSAPWEQGKATVYLPLIQRSQRTAYVVARVRGGVEAAASSLGSQVKKFDPHSSTIVAHDGAYQKWLNQFWYQPLIHLRILIVIAGLGFVLCAMAARASGEQYFEAKRKHLAIHYAVGATSFDLASRVLRQALMPAAGGTVVSYLFLLAIWQWDWLGFSWIIRSSGPLNVLPALAAPLVCLVAQLPTLFRLHTMKPSDYLRGE